MLHMDRVGVRELRLNVSQYLERVEAGETLEVTKRGRVIAVLAPAAPSRDARTHLIATGQLQPGRGDVRDLPPPVRSERSISEALRRLRENER